MLCIDVYFDIYRIVSYLRVFGCFGFFYDYICVVDVVRVYGV